MARSRYLKPTFFLDEELVELPFETRLLFAGLWTLADRNGRLEKRPKRIRMCVFPADNVDVAQMLDALERVGKIVYYSVGGVEYIAIPGWLKHQKVHPNEPASTIPPPPQSEPVVINGTSADTNGASADTNGENASRVGELSKENLVRRTLSPLPPVAGGARETPAAVDLSALARTIWSNHPKHRRPAVQAVERALAQIAMESTDPTSTAEKVCDRHAGWAASDEWRRDGCRFVPNLLRWLDPRNGGWMTDPPEAGAAERTVFDEMLDQLPPEDHPGGVQ